jgi:hypothetical protein
MPPRRKITDKAQLKLYVPEALRRRLEQAAKKNARPLNREMIDRLEESFQREHIERMVAGLSDRIAAMLGEGLQGAALKAVEAALRSGAEGGGEHEDKAKRRAGE